MATWMTHLRIGDLVFGAMDAPWLDPLYFAFGSVAPDNGMPMPDGRYEPSKAATHYGHSDDREYARFARENLMGVADDRAYSFYLGYYLHIVTDAAWVKGVYRAERRAFRSLFESDGAYNAAVKAEWDVLDFRFLRQTGAPRLLVALMNAHGMPAIECPFVPQVALEAQFVRTVEKYRAPGSADVPTKYLSEEKLDAFVLDFARRLAADMPTPRDQVWVNWDKGATQ